MEVAAKTDKPPANQEILLSSSEKKEEKTQTAKNIEKEDIDEKMDQASEGLTEANQNETPGKLPESLTKPKAEEEKQMEEEIEKKQSKTKNSFKNNSLQSTRTRKRRRELKPDESSDEPKKKKIKTDRKNVEDTKETHLYGSNYFTNPECCSLREIARLFDIPLKVLKHNNNQREFATEPLKDSDQFSYDTLLSVKRKKINFRKLQVLRGRFYTRTHRDRSSILYGDILHFPGGKLFDIHHVSGKRFSGKLWVWNGYRTAKVLKQRHESHEGEILGDVSLEKTGEKIIVTCSFSHDLIPPLLHTGKFALSTTKDNKKVAGTKKKIVRKAKRAKTKQKKKQQADPNHPTPLFRLNEEVQIIHSGDELWYPATIRKILINKFPSHSVVYKIEWIHHHKFEGERGTAIPEKGVRPMIFKKGDPVKVWNRGTHSYTQGRISERCRGLDERLRGDWKYRVFDVEDNSETDWVGVNDLVFNWRQRNDDMTDGEEMYKKELKIIRSHVGERFDKTIKAYSKEAKEIRSRRPEKAITISVKKGMKVMALSYLDGFYGQATVISSKRKHGERLFEIEWDNGEEEDTFKRKRELAPLEAFD